MPQPVPHGIRRYGLDEGQGGDAGLERQVDGATSETIAMVGEIVLAVLVVAFVGWLSRTAFRNIWTGRYPQDKGSGPGLMPPSGPDIGGGIGGP